MTPLRLLILEDRPADAALVLHEIRRAGFVIDWRRVETEAEYLAALDPALDLILADYALPQFDALQALRLTRERGYDIPFIIVSGSIGEGIAVAAMQQGAADYLLKDRLARLGQAVTQALDQRRLRIEKRRAEQALRESAALHEAVLRSLSAAIAVLDEAGTIITVNDAWVRFARENGDPNLLHTGPGVNYLEVCRRGADRFTEADAMVALAGLQAILDGAQSHFTLEYASHPATENRWYAMHATALVGRRGVVVAHEEITERKRAEIALRENHGLLHAVTEGTTDSVFVKDLQGRYLLMNSAGAHQLGKSVEEVLHQNDLALFELESAQRIMQHDREVLLSGAMHTYEEIATAAGVTRTYSTTKGPYYDYRGNIIGLIGIARDITARKQLEAQYSAAQRMESVGRLAGGVAHDFNNLLTAIGGYAEMSIDTLAPDHPAHNDLTELRNTVRRAANLTRQLLAFARRQIVEPQVFSLNNLIIEIDKLLRHLIGEDIELITSFSENPGRIRADPGQIEQVLVNLIVNARDAMPDGGTITIETMHATLDDDYAAQHPGVVAGEYILLAVGDTGIGMTDEIKQHIFEPFFTSKEPGHGTGLGMATCYGIVKQSGGNIWIYSEVGLGTTVKVYLPLVDETAEALPARGSGEHLDTMHGSETILLVEDEAAVRAVALRTLRMHGYFVLEAANGAEALRIAREQVGQAIQLLLTDVVMPNMDGKALADAIRALYPNIRVLFMSGYTDSAIVRRGLLVPHFELIQKPFVPLQLAQMVRRILDSTNDSEGAFEKETHQ